MKLNRIFISTILGLTLALSGCSDADKADTTKSNTTDTQSNIETTKDTPVSENAPSADTDKAANDVAADMPTYKVAMVTAFEPYSFRGENNEIVGFNVDLLNAIAEREKFQFSYIQTEWDSSFEMLTSGRQDMMGSLVAVTTERQKILDFSSSYMSSGYAAGVKLDFKEVTPKELIADHSITYSVLPKSILEMNLLELGVPQENMVPTKTEFLGVRNVLSGQTDAIFTETNVLRYYVGKYGGMRIIPINSQTLKIRFAVKKGNTELLEKINRGLESIKTDGTYDEIYNKWFAVNPNLL